MHTKDLVAGDHIMEIRIHNYDHHEDQERILSATSEMTDILCKYFQNMYRKIERTNENTTSSNLRDEIMITYVHFYEHQFREVISSVFIIRKISIIKYPNLNIEICIDGEPVLSKISKTIRNNYSSTHANYN